MASPQKRSRSLSESPFNCFTLSGPCSNQLSDRMAFKEGQDWTSKLPDELVVNVLSSLTLKETVRTSVLSKRWMNLWKSSDLALDFDASKELAAIYDSYSRKKKSLLKEKRNWFKNWVNTVVRQLQQHQQQEHNPTFRLKKFRVVFNFTNKHNSDGDMDRWVEFAISNRVESLDLFLHKDYAWTVELYDFSDRFYNHIKMPTGLSDIKPLRSLRLSHVEVRREGLEHFVANCPLLEELAVEYAQRLVKLRVVGSSQSPLRLKHFEVRKCWKLESLEIDHAPCLARLICDSCRNLDDWQVGECPRLVEVVLGFVELQFGNVFKALCGCTTRLEHLMVKTYVLGKVFEEVVEHTRLERLTMEVYGASNECFVELVPLINACPCLHTLRVVLHTTRHGAIRPQRSSVVKMRRESIKVVEIFGFRSDEMEEELLEYVLQYFVRLERIVVDRSVGVPIPLENFNFYVENRIKHCSEAEAIEAENLALRFKARAPPTLDFVIL